MSLTFDELPKAVERIMESQSKICAHLFELSKSNNSIEYPEVMDVKKAAKFLGRSESAIYNLVTRREIPFYKPDRNLTFLKSELLAWIKSHAVTTAADDMARISNNVIALNKK